MSDHPHPTCRLLAGALMLSTTVWLAACGGGGDSAGIGTGGTGSFSVGPITGFGSVFVNGVRYDDSGARLVDDDGTVTVVGSGASPLKVGMVVELSGSVDDSGTQRRATQIAYGAELKGPVSAVDVAAGSFVVFGVTVRTTATTVYDDFGGTASLAPGQVVEVHGQADAGGRIVATYVEREAMSEAAYAADDGEYRVRGPMARLAGSGVLYTFSVRGVEVRTDATTRIDGIPAEGAAVSVKLKPVRQEDGRYLAERLTLRRATYDAVSTEAEAEVEGYVSEFDAATGRLRVAGYAVQLGSNVVYEDGVAADLKNGVRVEAEGHVRNGVLIATKLEFESRDDDDDGIDDDVSSSSREFEFEGSASCTSCGASSGRFTIKGVTVSYDTSTQFRDGLSGTTLDGKKLEVKAVSELAAGGTVYRARRIELDD